MVPGRLEPAIASVVTLLAVALPSPGARGQAQGPGQAATDAQAVLPREATTGDMGGIPVFSDGFEAGDLCDWSVATSPKECAPRFPGITLAVATGPREVTLAWLPATDDLTPAASLSYRVHLGETSNFPPSGANLAATVTGGTDLVLSGVAPATTYHVLILAEDADGRRSSEREYRSVSTPTFPTTWSATTPLQQASDLGLGVPATVEANRLIFARTSSSTPPAVGSVLTGSLDGARRYFRRVESVSQTSSGIEVETSMASLEDAIEQTDLSSSATLLDPNAASGASRGAWPGTFSTSVSGLADGTRVSRATWQDRLVKLERVDHAVDTGEIRLKPGRRAGQHDVVLRSTTVGGPDLTATIDLSFHPELVTDADWSPAWGTPPVELRTARLIARGILRMEALAELSFGAAASYDPDPFPLFTTTWTSVYPLPGTAVLIYQEVTLDVGAELSASARAAFSATAESFFESRVEVGLVYDDATGWETVNSLNQDRGSLARLGVGGTAAAQIRIIPELSVEFYEVVTGRISVEPYASGTITAQGTLDPLCAPLELTTFDLGLGVQCFAGVDLTPFSVRYPLWEGQICDPVWPMFGLPSFAPTSSGTGPVVMSANPTDGFNNPFDPASTLWNVTGPDATISVTSVDPPRASLECTANGTYTVTFAGNGRLGPLARQCEQLAVPCSKDPDIAITRRVSVASDGTQATSRSRAPSISADGRYIAFSSRARNLVTGDTNVADDVFVHDVGTGQTSRVSVASDGTQGNSASASPSISADGRYIAFLSEASDLVDGDTNETFDVFVHDLETAHTSRVSVASDGTEGNSGSLSPSISADGRYIAFDSHASNLVDSDTNGATDVFVHDLETGHTSRVNIASDGTQANGYSDAPSISGDGRYIAFRSTASNLVAGDTNRSDDVFVHDLETGHTRRVSVDSDGTEGVSGSLFPSISADGRFVAFQSLDPLVPSDGNRFSDVYVHDVQTGQTRRVSVASDGTEANSLSLSPSISGDGRFIAFLSLASNLVAGDSNGFKDVYVHDAQTGQTDRISIASDSTEANDDSLRSSISTDGRFVAFSSVASNLVASDTNGDSDVFLHGPLR